MSSSVITIVPAAGRGRRLGLDRSKGLLEVGSGGELAVSLVVRALSMDVRVQRIVVTVDPEDRASFLKIDFKKICYLPVDIIAGGETRQLSVSAGLNFVRQNYPEQFEYVLVHDAARCLVTNDLVRRCIDGAVKHSAITAAIPMVDSVKECSVEGAGAIRVGKSLDRNLLWSVQTPQVFKFELLCQAHQAPITGASDDASLVEAIHPVYIIEGQRNNLKITNPEDLEYARYLFTLN